MMTVDEVKKKLGIAGDNELAKRAGRGASAVSNWRRDGKIPASVLMKLGVVAGDQHQPSDAFEVPNPTGKIPIISWAQAGPDGFFEDSHPAGGGFGDINRPYGVTDPNAYALIVSGDSMIPKFEPGDVILVSPNMGVRTGDYAVVRLKDGTVAAKRVKAKNHVFILESVNPEYPPVECPAEDVVFTHRIVWVKQRG